MEELTNEENHIDSIVILLEKGSDDFNNSIELFWKIKSSEMKL